MLTRTLAQELAGDGVRVVGVSPIGVETELVAERDDEDESFLAAGTEYAGRYNLLDPGQRIDPGDVTEAVLWLTSDAARRITGVTLPVDAGGLA
jgi:NAD(P)-dependent dehydrogenase (short-subunit alcohol dehydrogenase family)